MGEDQTIGRADIIHPTPEAEAEEVNRIIREAKKQGIKLKDMRLVEERAKRRYTAKLVPAPKKP